MKKISLLVILLLALSSFLMADEDLEQAIELLRTMKGMENVNVSVLKAPRGGLEADDAAYFGLYLEDLSFPKAQSLNYKGNIGVLITGVVKDSPAWQYRLREDDIIVSLANKEITNYAAFEKVRKGLRAGDVINVIIFRDGKTESFDMVIGAREADKGQKIAGVAQAQVPGRKLSAGYGGGTWVPLWIKTDIEDINKLIGANGLGFSELPEGYILQQGIAGKFPIGKGYFLGGQITGYNDSKRISSTANPNYHLWLQYDRTLGGITLDKRIPFSKNIIGSLGLMVGGANHSLEFVNTDANFDWTDMDSTITASNNTHIKLSKGYFIAQPKAELLLRLTSWMGLRAESGYVYGVNLRENWRVVGMGDELYDVKNSPNTNHSGITFSVGPWFGF